MSAILSSIGKFIVDRLNEPTTRAAIATGVLSASGAILAGYDAKVAILAFIGSVGGILCPEVKSVFDKLEPPIK